MTNAYNLSCRVLELHEQLKNYSINRPHMLGQMSDYETKMEKYYE